MAVEDVGQPFRFEHVEGAPQSEHEMLGRGAAILLVVLRAFAERPIPIARHQACVFVCGAGLFSRGDERQSGRGHQALLRSGYGHVHAPSVHLERHTGERRDGVHHEQGRVIGVVHCRANGRNVVDDAGRGVDLHREDRLDLSRPVGAQTFGDRGGHDCAPRLGGEYLDIEAEHVRQVGPRPAEQAAVECQHLVPAAEAVRQRGFPRPVPVRGIDVGAALRAEHSFEVGQATRGDFDDLADVQIDRGAVHRRQHVVRYRGGARNGEELASAAQRHARASPTFVCIGCPGPGGLPAGRQSIAPLPSRRWPCLR